MLKIPDTGALDFLAVGALVHRLDPGVVPFPHASQLAIHVSGGEYNCAANLASCFGMRAGVAAAMVSYPIGDMIDRSVRAMGVRPFYKRFEHDGVRGPNMATVYSDRGAGVRAPEVFYNRANEAAALLRPGDFDWDAIMRDGVRWLHSGGIFAALSPTTPQVIVEAMQAAKAAGAVVSFDLNYRHKLWQAAGGADGSIADGSDIAEHAHATLRAIVSNVDVLVGNEEDLQQGLGIAGPDTGGQKPNGQQTSGQQTGGESKLDPRAFLRMIDRVTAEFPGISVVATTLREVDSANRHYWSAVAWIDGHAFTAPTRRLDVYDRVGGGDGFAAGFIYGLLAGEPPESALRLGWAHGALITTFPGDTTMATLDQVRTLAGGSSARILR